METITDQEAVVVMVVIADQEAVVVVVVVASANRGAAKRQWRQQKRQQLLHRWQEDTIAVIKTECDCVAGMDLARFLAVCKEGVAL